jgi:hypothetical protein
MSVLPRSHGHSRPSCARCLGDIFMPPACATSLCRLHRHNGVVQTVYRAVFGAAFIHPGHETRALVPRCIDRPADLPAIVDGLDADHADTPSPRYRRHGPRHSRCAQPFAGPERSRLTCWRCGLCRTKVEGVYEEGGARCCCCARFDSCLLLSSYGL